MNQPDGVNLISEKQLRDVIETQACVATPGLGLNAIMDKAQYPEDCEVWESLIDIADKKMYQHKRGKNKPTQEHCHSSTPIQNFEDKGRTSTFKNPARYSHHQSRQPAPKMQVSPGALSAASDDHGVMVVS